MKLYLKLLMALALALGLVGCDKGAPFVPVDTAILPLVYTRVKPRNTVMVARVAMKGATRPMVTIRPLIAPKPVPMRQATTIPTVGFMPPTMKLPIKALARAKMEPTERSIPPVKITKVIPKEIRALIET